MTGDCHVRFCERLGLKCPCLLDATTIVRSAVGFAAVGLCWQALPAIKRQTSKTIHQRSHHHGCASFFATLGGGL
jgi:hypothetical protein